MNLHHFNAAILVGWLMVLAGGMWINPGAGLVAAGLLLLVLTLFAARIAGGLYEPPSRGDELPAAEGEGA